MESITIIRKAVIHNFSSVFRLSISSFEEFYPEGGYFMLNLSQKHRKKTLHVCRENCCGMKFHSPQNKTILIEYSH